MRNTNDNYSAILLTLYKGRYGIDEPEEGVMGYRVIGEFDYLRIQGLDASLTTEDQYKEMWAKTELISKKLKIGESCHNLYAVGKKDKQYAKDFWNETSYPFLFLSMIQLRMGDEIELSVVLENIEQFLTDLIVEYKYDIKVSVYYSLDSCDYLLFLKARSYDDGSKIIQGMPSIPYDNNRTLNYYCYSLCGINIERYLLSQSEKIIKKIMICFVIKNFNIFNQWLKKMKEKFPAIDESIPFKNNRGKQFSYSRLGNEDVCINIMNCRFDLFLRELHAKGGLLNNSNDLFRKGLMKLRLHIDSTPYYEEVETNIPDSQSFSTLIDRFRNCVSGDLEDILYPTTKKALFEVLNSCSYFEQEYFVKDIQVCIQNSFDIFLSKFHEFRSWQENMDPRFKMNYTQMDFNNSVIEFINGIMSVVNGALHTDRMFFQAPGFNAVLYDIPAKLLAFYTAFVKNITVILNDNKEKEFAYLLCPDLYLKIVLIKLFDNPYEYPVKRLLKGSIPVKSIFEPKRLMMELAHEVAHCVGDQYRMRVNRYYSTIQMFSDTLVYYLFQVVDDKEERVVKELFAQGGENNEMERFQGEISQYISKWLDRKFETTYKKGDPFNYYQVKTKVFFELAIQELLQNPNELFSFIEKRYLEIFMGDKQELAETVEKIYALNNIMESNIMTIQSDRYMYKINAGIHSLTNESYADLIMCKLLGLSCKEYISRFYNTNRELVGEEDVDFLYENATGERILSVINTLGENINEQAEDEKHPLYRKYLDSLKNFDETRASMRMKTISFPKKIIKDNEVYLRNCLKQIEEDMMDKKFEDARKLYKNVTEQDIFTSVQSIFEVVYKMRSDVEQEMNAQALP